MSRSISLISAAVLLTLVCSCTSSGPGKAADGNYIGTAKGYGGDVDVSLSLKSGKISELTVQKQNESPEYGVRAVNELPADIVKNNSLGVDAISGATITSQAIFRAAADALQKAGADPKDYQYTPLEEIQAADNITITGLPDGKTADFTGDQLMGMESVTVNTTSVDSAGNKQDVTATGVKLETVLQSLGVSQKDFDAIVLTATDGYSIEVPASVLNQRDIIIAWNVDGAPESLRTVVPGEYAMYWVKFLSKIDLEGQVKTVETDTVLLMETMIANLSDKTEDYPYNGSTDKAVPISAMLEKYTTAKPQTIVFTSTDQWGETEKYDTAASQYIKFTGGDAPLFIGPSLPEGMRLKQTVSMKLDNEVIVDAGTAMQKLNEQGSLPVSSLFSYLQMKQADSYQFTGDDGYETEISSADISKGKISVEDGKAVVRFDGLANNTTVNGLLKITAV